MPFLHRILDFILIFSCGKELFSLLDIKNIKSGWGTSLPSWPCSVLHWHHSDIKAEQACLFGFFSSFKGLNLNPEIAHQSWYSMLPLKLEKVSSIKWDKPKWPCTELNVGIWAPSFPFPSQSDDGTVFGLWINPTPGPHWCNSLAPVFPPMFFSPYYLAGLAKPHESTWGEKKENLDRRLLCTFQDCKNTDRNTFQRSFSIS